MARVLACLASLVTLGCQSLVDFAPLLGDLKVSYTMKNGELVEGTLLQSEEGQSLVQIQYGAVMLSAGDIESTTRLGREAASDPGAGRLATLATALRVMAKQPLGTALLPVPATVVTTGPLRNVPYSSLRAGNFEFNVYGDPESPAGVEIGVYGTVNSLVAKRLCLAALKQVLSDPADRKMLDALSLDGSATKQRAGLTFEVTPPTAPDAFGGWWLSVYDDGSLEQQRATDRELRAITIPRSQIKTAETPSVTAWKPHELRLSRPEELMQGDRARVYLRGIHRRDGEYVAFQPS
jgi:hypothetical protein